MGKDCFKDALQIVDFYHALVPAGEVLQALLGKDHPDYEKRRRQWAKQLLQDKVQKLIDQTRKEGAGQPQAAAVEEALRYFVRNVSRMQYGTFRAADLAQLLAEYEPSVTNIPRSILLPRAWPSSSPNTPRTSTGSKPPWPANVPKWSP